MATSFSRARFDFSQILVLRRRAAFEAIHVLQPHREAPFAVGEHFVDQHRKVIGVTQRFAVAHAEVVEDGLGTAPVVPGVVVRQVIIDIHQPAVHVVATEGGYALVDDHGNVFQLRLPMDDVYGTDPRARG